MTFAKTSARILVAVAASAPLLAAPAAFAQSAGTSYTGTSNGVPTTSSGGGLNPQAGGSSTSGGGTVNPSGVSGTEAGKTTATGGNAGGAAGRQ